MKIQKSKDINSIDLNDVTNIIVDQKTYEDMSNSDKRNLNRVLKSEVNNKKEIIFWGDENSLNPIRISENLDLDTFSDISDLSTNTKVFAVSFSKDLYGDNVLSFYRTDCELDEEQALQCFSDIITSDFESANEENMDANSFLVQKLDPKAVSEDQQVITYYLRNTSNVDEAIIRTIMKVHRVGVKNRYSSDTVSTWEIKMEMDIHSATEEIVSVYACTAQGNPNDEERLKSWPTTSLGSGSHTFSFGGDSGVSTNMGYTYNINFTDIDLITYIPDGNVENYVWAFGYKYGSNVSMFSSYLEVGAIYTNSKGNFTLEAESGIKSTSRNMGGAAYRFSLKDILVK